MELAYALFTLTDTNDPHTRKELTEHGMFYREMDAERFIDQKGLTNAWVESKVVKDFAEEAKIIFGQLGGINRLRAMVGATNYGFSSIHRQIHFMFKMFPKANTLYVKLNANDTYTMQFAKVTLRKGIKIVQEYEDVYAEDLVPIFKRFTGLELTIPRVIGINAN